MLYGVMAEQFRRWRRRVVMANARWGVAESIAHGANYLYGISRAASWAWRLAGTWKKQAAQGFCGAYSAYNNAGGDIRK